MNKKIKKLLLPLMILGMCLIFSGCGEEEPLAFEVNQNIMQSYTQKIIMQYYSTSDFEQDYYLNDGDELQKTAVAGFLAAESTDHVGKFVSFRTGEDAVSIKNGVNGKVICTQLCKYENRDVEVTVSYLPNRAYELDKEKVYNNLSNAAAQYNMDVASYVTQMYGDVDGLDLVTMDGFLESFLAVAYDEYPYIPQDCEVSAVYSKTELVTMAGKNTAIGMGVVFIVLIFISFIISLLKYLPLLFDSEIRREREEKKAAELAAQKRTEEVIIARNKTEDKEEKKAEPASVKTSASEELVGDEELVAVITAAIYAATGMKVRGPAYTASNDRLVVRSIRRAK